MRIDKPINYAVTPKKDCARYKMHKYWAAKPWYVVAEYIEHFTQEGEIVMDPFCGSGVVGCEALIHRRKTVLNDLNPMATFIARNICSSPIDLKRFDKEFINIKNKLRSTIVDMYRLIEPCPECGAPLYIKHLVRGPSLENRWIVEARCSNGHGRSGHIRRYLTPEEKAFIATVERCDIPYWFPQNTFPDGREIMRLKNVDINRVDQLFTRRNLIALSLLHNEIQKISDVSIKELMLMAFSNTLLHVSKLKSEALRPMSANSYYCMGDWIEENVWERFENRVNWHWGVYQGKQETNRLIDDYFNPVESFDGFSSGGTFMISNGPAQDLSNIPDESIDYCFTDPPYGGSIQYFELTYLWRSWLDMSHGFIDNEVIVNDFQGKQYDSFETMLTEVFREVYRVMKPGRWLSVTFNNRDTRIWEALLKACQIAGFEIINVVPQNPVGHSFVQSWSGKALKRDLILNFRKPKAVHYNQTNCNDFEEYLNIREMIIESARDFLSKNQRALLSEIYEAVVIRWINMVYGGLKRKTSTDEDNCKEIQNKVFDIDTVDRILEQESDFSRIEDNNRIFYRKNTC
ncbi:MAG: DNA methyltransferase [Tepidanaerobacteraceae bacterium]|nr:DNA methyltransferase [Tepidanaerobacteraceae bacterium]